MTTVRINDYIKTRATQIEDALEKLLPATPGLNEASRYALLGAGKRLRPILTLAVVESLDGPIDAAFQPACALEMIHAYSMVHDDLPCMDDDDVRRGKPTVHKQFSESTALLAGDHLLTYAFEVLANSPQLTPQQVLTLIQELAQASGSKGMIGGQYLDLEAEGKAFTLEDLQTIHSLKTGALLGAAIRFGGIISNATSEVCQHLEEYSEAIGLGFQITDDIIDVTHSKEKHGGNTSSDEARGKATYVALLGLDGARQAADEQFERAMSALAKLPNDTYLLEALAKRIIYRTR